jgi:uncharacterized protein YkwD
MRVKQIFINKFRLEYAFFLVLTITTACQADSPEAFVLGDADYMLNCIPEGESESALACRSAYLVNRDRAANSDESNGAKPLDWDTDLAWVAEQYSRKMCENGLFDHIDEDGNRVGERLTASSVAWAKCGENLARGNNLSPEIADQQFMDEPACELNHRGNILDRDFTHIGVGVFFCGSSVYYTQVFATFDSFFLNDGGNEFCTFQ